MTRLFLCFFLLLVVACPKSTSPEDAGVDTGNLPDVPSVDVPARDSGPMESDANTTETGPIVDARSPDVVDGGPPPSVESVDLLFIIDNSGSMSQEQESLARELPALVDALVTGRAASGPFPPVADLRVGVVSSDMGTGGFAIPTCSEPNFGDDGILSRDACERIPFAEPPYLQLREGGPGPVSFARDLSCLVNLGTQGCGFEQQLDAMLKAVTPSTGDIEFVNRSRGQEDGANEDFVRDDALLALVLLTDEDDCSAADPDVFNRDSSRYPSPDLNLRCWQYPEATHPVSRYVEGLLEDRDPENLLYHLVAGIPVDLAPALGMAPDYALLIGGPAERDPRMIPRVDPMRPSQLTPSCRVVGRGEAYPPERLVGVAQGLEEAGASVVVQSICQDELSFAAALSEAIATRLR